MADNKALTSLNEYVDERLRENRPDRYAPGADWLDDVADSIPDDLLPEAEVRKLLMREIVGRREGQSTKRANKLLRELGEHGQLVLDWWDDANDPISLESEIVDDHGNIRTIKERVALRAATFRDLESWARHERKRADRDHASRMAAVEGAEFAALSMRHARAGSFSQWAEVQFSRPAA